MSNIRSNYLKILEVINSLNIYFYSPNSIGRKPKIADIEVVALSLTAEFMSLYIANDLFRQISNVDIPNLIERSQFNKRRRKLIYLSEAIRLALFSKFIELEDYFIVVENRNFKFKFKPVLSQTLVKRRARFFSFDSVFKIFFLYFCIY